MLGVSGGLLVGLVLGLFLGLLVGPLIRAWLSWQEWTNASRDADLPAARARDRRDAIDRTEDEAWLRLEVPEAAKAPFSTRRGDAS